MTKKTKKTLRQGARRVRTIRNAKEVQIYRLPGGGFQIVEKRNRLVPKKTNARRRK